MNKVILLVVAISAMVYAGRYAVPGHALSYAGTYEAFAHIWVGVLIALAFRKELRVVSLVCLAVTTALEAMMFLMRST